MARRSRREQKAKKQDRYAKQKLLAIPMLLAVLGYVLLDNFSGSSQDAPAATTGSAHSSARPSGQVESTAAVAGKGQAPVQQLAVWPQPQLDFLEGPSPLASYREPAGAIVRPAASPEGTMVAERRAEKSEQIESKIRETLANQPSQFVFKSANRKLALVGDRVFEQGEQLESGARLHDVRGNNLVIRIGRQID